MKKQIKNPNKLETFQFINNKLVIKKPSNAIYYLPHNKKPIQEELVLRVILNYPEPEESSSLQKILDYHTNKNLEVIKELSSQFTDILFTDYSTTSPEIWLGFPTNDSQIIESLCKSDIVGLIYIYTNKFDKNFQFTTHSVSMKNSDDEANAIEMFKIKSQETISIISAMDLHRINSLTISNSKYDSITKTLTLDLNHHNTPSEIEQLFTYIYAKQPHHEQLIKQLSFIIFQHILINYEETPISVINFCTQASDVVSSQSIQLFPVVLSSLDNKRAQEEFVNRKYTFKKSDELLHEHITTAIKYATVNYQNLFKAIMKDTPTFYEISLMNPDNLQLVSLTSQTVNRINVLYPKFTNFDTQERMNMLYAYLASEPSNKEYWINKISSLILSGLEQNNLPPLNKFSFISFDEVNSPLDVTQASIGGIGYSVFSPESESNDTKLKWLFPNFSTPLTNIDSLIDQINLNISWNRNTYSQYNNSHKLLFPNTILAKRDLPEDQRLINLFNDIEAKVNSLNFTNVKFDSQTNNLHIALNNFTNSSELETLFAIITNNYRDTAEKWLNKIVDVIASAISSINKKINEISYIDFNIGSNRIDLTQPSVGGYDRHVASYDIIEPDEIVDDNGMIHDKTAIKKGLMYYIESNINKLTQVLAEKNLIMSKMSKKDFGMQYTTVGLNKYFNKINSNISLGFDHKMKNKLGILEAGGGIIDTNSYHFDNPIVLDDDPETSSYSPHSDLIGRIMASTIDGVDQTSTIVSAGFNESNPKSKWNFFKIVDWMVEQGIQLLNCSWGLKKEKPEDPDFVSYEDWTLKLDYVARKFGITIFMAAGNSHTEFKPFFRDTTLAINSVVVGSTNRIGTKLSAFSDYEKNPAFEFTKDAPKPLLVAPGEGYRYRTKVFNGTSFATPLVCASVSLLLKEFPTLRSNPAAIMAVLAASSSPLITDNGNLNNNGLFYKTGAGLFNYPNAQLASANVINQSIANNLDVGEVVIRSKEFTLENYQEVIVASAALFNGGYVRITSGPNLLPVRGTLNALPIIGYIYLSIAYHINNNRANNYKLSITDDISYKKLLQLINDANLDESPVTPPVLGVKVLQFNESTQKWEKITPNTDATSNSSNIKRYIVKNNSGSAKRYKYEVHIVKKAKHLEWDLTENKVAATHIIRNI